MGTLHDLWRRYSARPNAELRRELIEAYAPLTKYVVDRMNLKPSSALGYEDLLSQAVVGLIDAVDKFDPKRGVKFETYAYHRIRGAVVDMLRELDWLPRSLRQREAEMVSVYADLEKRLSRPPTDEELAAGLSLTVDQLDELAQEVALQAVQSLDDSFVTLESGAGTVSETVPDSAALSPEAEAERWSEREMVARAIAGLPENERTVISLYYYEGLTLKEIGEVLGVTESRACQIHGKAVVRLRAQLVPALSLPPGVGASAAGKRAASQLAR